MKYTKIRIEDKYFPKRLYRIVALKGNPKLSVLGAVFGKLFEASFEHYYMFRTRKDNFVPASWLDNFGPDKSDHAMNRYSLNDLTDEFEYEYDTGEGYVFRCKKYKTPADINIEDCYEDDYPDVMVLEGKGAGIFENNHGMLDDYLSGELSGEFDDDCIDEENYYQLPYNLSLNKLSDFDEKLDLDDYEFSYYDVDYIASHFEEEDYGNELDDFEEDDEYDEWLLKEEVAVDIFFNKNVNKVFKELIKNNNIDEAYQLILQKYKEVNELDDKNNYSADEYGKIFQDRINSLIKN